MGELGRRAESPFNVGTFRLLGLASDAQYVFQDVDGAGRRSMSGKDLLSEGIRIDMPEPRSAKVIFFNCLPAKET